MFTPERGTRKYESRTLKRLDLTEKANKHFLLTRCLSLNCLEKSSCLFRFASEHEDLIKFLDCRVKWKHVIKSYSALLISNAHSLLILRERLCSAVG